MPKSVRNLTKIIQNLLPEALGDGLVATVAPRCPQDSKRDEKMLKIVLPRGTQRGLKIVIFGLKLKQNRTAKGQ